MTSNERDAEPPQRQRAAGGGSGGARGGEGRSGAPRRRRRSRRRGGQGGNNGGAAGSARASGSERERSGGERERSRDAGRGNSERNADRSAQRGNADRGAASSGGGTRRRRRRRGGSSGAGGGRGAGQAATATGAASASNRQDTARPAGGRNASAGNRNATAGGRSASASNRSASASGGPTRRGNAIPGPSSHDPRPRPGPRGSGRTGASRPMRGASRSSVAQFPTRTTMAVWDSGLPVSREESAGGLVLSGLAEAVGKGGRVDLSAIYVALIGRLDRRGRLLWSMPKGHVEPDESRASTAEREVWEETGVHGEAIQSLGTIEYRFVSEGLQIHKTVHHYLLRFVDGILNDEDPEVTEVTWIPVSDLVERLAYADERGLARQALAAIPALARAEAAAGRVTPR